MFLGAVNTVVAGLLTNMNGTVGLCAWNGIDTHCLHRESTSKWVKREFLEPGHQLDADEMIERATKFVSGIQADHAGLYACTQRYSHEQFGRHS